MKEISDKIYWHKYIEFYKKRLPKEVTSIMEIGVFKGESIKYWRDLYAKANIYGIDIIQQKSNWPIDENIKYFQLDQSDILRYRKILKEINTKFDILIDDGSHDPLHQKISLIESIPFMNKKSIYILEDIHTSHKNHPIYKKRLKRINSTKNIFHKKYLDYFMTLQCILLLEYMKRLQIPISYIDSIDFNKSLFNKNELLLLYSKVKKVEIFKRSILPDYCYACKKNDYDFSSLRCKCGVDLYAGSDSMSAVLYF